MQDIYPTLFIMIERIEINMLYTLFGVYLITIVLPLFLLKIHNPV